MLSSGCVSPSAVPFEVPHEVVPCGFELVPDEAEAEHPAPESVSFVFGLLLLRTCAPDLLGQLAHRHAKLDHAFKLSGVQAALALGAFFVEVEAPELDGVVPVEVAVEVKHAVPCAAVVAGLCRAVVPAPGEGLVGLRLPAVDPF